MVLKRVCVAAEVEVEVGEFARLLCQFATDLNLHSTRNDL